MIAANGQSLVLPYPFASLQDKGIGVSKAVKTVALGARVQAWSHGHGGCDDSSGDTRLARGLPFGSMPWVRPPHPMPADIVQREGEERARATRRPGSGHQRQRRSRRVRPAPFEPLHLHAAGIAVGATEPWGAVPAEREAQPVQRCGAFTADLYACGRGRVTPW